MDCYSINLFTLPINFATPPSVMTRTSKGTKYLRLRNMKGIPQSFCLAKLFSRGRMSAGF